MTTRTSLDTTVPPTTSSSPRSKELHNIGSLTVTSVVSGEPLQGAQKSSDNAMQTVQRQQAQPAAAPTLAPSRVNTSVEDDLDNILNNTLGEFFADYSSSSSSSAQPQEFHASSSSSSPSSVQSTDSLSLDFDPMEPCFSQIEMLLCSISVTPFAERMAPPNFKDILAKQVTINGQLVNELIEFINQFFQSLLAQSANLGAWLERESKTPFFCNTHPFEASYFLTTTLDRATTTLSHLDQPLLANWKDNYKNCVLLLKKNDLDRYNKTEFPFSVTSKLIISMIQTQAEQYQKNPDLLQQQMSAFAQNPEAMLDQLGVLGSASAAENELDEQKLLLQIAFFKKLDLVLQKTAKNAGDVEAWLKAKGAKSTYQHPFYYFKTLVENLSKIPFPEKTLTLITTSKVLYESCCEQLTALGLQSYINEPPPKEVLGALRQHAMTHKETFQEALSKSVSFLTPLSEELKKLKFTPEALEANRQTIEGWITSCKAAGTYFPPFMVGQDMCQPMSVLEEILDGEKLQALSELLPVCREQLLALGLTTYLEEMPPHTNTTTASTTAAISAPIKVLLDTERFKREIVFFREMVQQKDEALDQWLKDNSPKSDYPLLWAKKRFPQLSHFRGTVDMDLRYEWRMCSDACFEKIVGPALKHHMDIANIPADASTELRAYLA